MRRSARINLALACVVALLGAAVWWQVQGERQAFEPPLSTLSPAAVNQLSVRAPGLPVRRFERRDGHWFMLEPWALPANDMAVDRLASIAQSPVRSRRPLADFEPARIGVDPPWVALDVDDLHLAIGQSDVFNGDRYVLVGDQVALVPDRFSPYLLAPPETELDLHLLPRASRLASVRLGGSDSPALADAWAAAMARQIRTAHAQPGDRQVAAVDITLADGQAIHFDLIDSADGPIARRQQPALDYVLDAATAATLHAAP